MKVLGFANWKLFFSNGDVVRTDFRAVWAFVVIVDINMYVYVLVRVFVINYNNSISSIY